MCNISNVIVSAWIFSNSARPCGVPFIKSHGSFQEGLGPGVAVVFISSNIGIQEYISVNVLISAPHV